VAAGEPRKLSKRQRKTVDLAVQDAEQRAGLQFCVYLGKASEDPRQHAESLFVAAGLHERPAVLILVAPDRHKVEIVTAPDARERIPDEACALAIEEMTPLLAEGRYDAALITGLRRLADEAGAATGTSTDLPNILDG
jgi:uncharacterized membrane protein YgcG